MTLFAQYLSKNLEQKDQCNLFIGVGREDTHNFLVVGPLSGGAGGGFKPPEPY